MGLPIDHPAAQAAIAQGKLKAPPSGGAKPSKMGNQVIKAEGKKVYDSQLEADVHAKLVKAYGAQNVIHQPSLPIEGGRIRPDFLIVLERLPSGAFVGELVDAKGSVTPAWRKSAKQLAERHGLAVRLIGKEDL